MFDEIHKYGKWKNFLKGFFDLYEKKSKIIVTGSARLNIYKKGGDSLMGRYFYYRIHPLSVAEMVSPTLIQEEIRLPAPIGESDWKALLEHGGFPGAVCSTLQAIFPPFKSHAQRTTFSGGYPDWNKN